MIAHNSLLINVTNLHHITHKMKSVDVITMIKHSNPQLTFKIPSYLLSKL